MDVAGILGVIIGILWGLAYLTEQSSRRGIYNAKAPTAKEIEDVLEEMILIDDFEEEFLDDAEQ